jgi:hypothetical protein
MMPEDTNVNVHTEADPGTSALTALKWGRLASFVLAVGFIVPPSIYLLGIYGMPPDDLAMPWLISCTDRSGAPGRWAWW